MLFILMVMDLYNYAAFNFCKKYKVKHIIAPCGMLLEEALLQSRLRKKLSWYLYQKNVINHASMIHLKSEKERTNSLDKLQNQPLTIIPNPIEISGKKQEQNDSNGFFKA